MAVFNPNRFASVSQMLLDGLGFEYQSDTGVFFRNSSDPAIQFPATELNRHTPTTFYERMKEKGWWKETQDIPTHSLVHQPKAATLTTLPEPTRIIAVRTFPARHISFGRIMPAPQLESPILRAEADTLLAKLTDRVRLAHSETTLRRFQAAVSIVRYAYEIEIQTTEAKEKNDLQASLWQPPKPVAMPPCGAPPDIVNHFLNQLEKSPAVFRPSLEEIRKIYPDAQPVPIPMWKYRELQKDRSKS